MPAIGFLKKYDDGSYKGTLETISICTPLELRPFEQDNVLSRPAFKVFANGLEIGSAKTRIGQQSNSHYISVSFACPEFGAKALTANLGPAAGQSDQNVFALIWNPEN